jgi:hypothetical protein
MRNLSQLEHALDLVDQANREDPNRHSDRPLAYFQGVQASQWLAQLRPNASDELQIAARAHHLRRWEIERSSFPTGRAGYLKWRAANKAHQVDSVLPLLAQVRLGEGSVARVAELLSRRSLKTDPETQALEDVACLVFLQTQYQGLADRTEPARLAAIVAKTLAKMSPDAISLASQLRLELPTG